MEAGVDFKELERNNLFSILIYLYRNGRCLKSSLYDVSKTNTLPQKISFLIENGFIIEDHRRFENNSKYIELTEKGLKVARRISDIEDIINDRDTEADQLNHGPSETEGTEARS